MADLAPTIDHSSVDGNKTGTLQHDVNKLVSRAVFGQINDGASRPNITRIIHVSPDDAAGVDGAYAQIDAATIPAGEWVLVQLGPGHYDASKFAFVGQTRVITRGAGEATVIDVAANTTAGSPPSDTGYPNSLRFSGNTKCGLEDMRVEFTDSAAGATITQGAIARRNNTNSTDCWFKNVTIVVNEIDAARTGAGSQVYGIDLVSSTNGDAWGMRFINVNIISSNSGIVLGAGEIHFEGCNIWVGNTARTGGPHIYGINWKFNCRWYYWGGKLGTGYGTLDPNSTRDVYIVRFEPDGADGVGWIYNSVSFGRNTGAGNKRIVYAVGATGSTSPWLRITGSYMQAEDAITDVEAIETDWVPSEGSTDGNIVQLDNNIRISGILGNAIGNDGRVEFSGDISIPSSFKANWFASGLSADATVTLHSNEPISNDEFVIKNSDSTYNVIVQTEPAASDQLDGVVDGSVTIPPGGMIKIVGRKLSGSDILYETMEKNFYRWYENMRMGIGGEVINGQVMPRWLFKKHANTTSKIIGISRRIESGTSFTFDVQHEGVDITGLAGITCTTTEQYTAATTPVTVADAEDAQIVDISSATGTPAVASFDLVVEHTVITKGA